MELFLPASLTAQSRAPIHHAITATMRGLNGNEFAVTANPYYSYNSSERRPMIGIQESYTSLLYCLFPPELPLTLLPPASLGAFSL